MNLHAEIVLLAEANDWLDKVVRVTGHIEFIDCRSRKCGISHDGVLLEVDLSLCGIPIGYYDGVLVQFIGTLRKAPSSSGCEGAESAIPKVTLS
jgi:hypothetical protein